MNWKPRINLADLAIAMASYALPVIIIGLVVMFPNQALAYVVKSSGPTISAVAGEALVVGNVASIAAADGKAYKAKSDSITLRPAIGVVTKAATSGANTAIAPIATLTGWSSLNPGAPAYLSATAGAVTQTAPANYFQQVGVALSATTYSFDFQPGRSSVTVDSTSHTATNTTTDGTSIAIPAGMFAAGKTLRIAAGGTITGANAAKSVILYVDDAAILTLSTTAAAAGNWMADFVIGEYTDSAHQICIGKLVAGAATGATTADVKAQNATDTTDFSAAKTIKLQVVSANAGDTIVQTYGIVEFLP